MAVKEAGELSKPRIVAVKHKQLVPKSKKKELTPLEESLVEEIKTRGENVPKEFLEEENGENAIKAQEGAEDRETNKTKQEKKPKVVEQKAYSLEQEPEIKKTSILKVQEDIVKEMREQAVKDITPVRKEVGRPVQAKEEGTVEPELEKKRLVEEAIKKHEQIEEQKSFVGRFLKKIGFR